MLSAERWRWALNDDEWQHFEASAVIVSHLYYHLYYEVVAYTVYRIVGSTLLLHAVEEYI
jgi:hypothetical protein